jgi:hypothetical protein
LSTTPQSIDVSDAAECLNIQLDAYAHGQPSAKQFSFIFFFEVFNFVSI